MTAREARRKIGTRMARKKLRTVKTKLHQARLAKARSAKRK